MARKRHTHYQISYEDELRWVGILFQLVCTRIAIHQTPVSPPPGESQATSVPAAYSAPGLFLTDTHGPTFQAHRCPVGEDWKATA